MATTRSTPRRKVPRVTCCASGISLPKRLRERTRKEKNNKRSKELATKMKRKRTTKLKRKLNVGLVAVRKNS